MRLSSLAILSIGLGSCPSAYAKFYDMYRADYTKGAFCVAIAGACASDDNPENSFFQNPASLEAGEKGLVFDGDYNPSDNPEVGMKQNDDFQQTSFMAGAGWASKDWGLGFGMSGRQTSVKVDATLTDDAGTSQRVKSKDSSTTLLFNFPVAYQLNKQISVGAALLGMYYTETLEVEGSPKSNTKNIDKVPQFGFSFGSIIELNRDLHFGTWLRTPITYYVNQQLVTQQFSTTISILEDIGLNYPWILASGFSFRPFGDPRTVFIDLDFVGSTTDGYQRTLDTFASAANDKVIRKKGRSIVLEPHLAWRSPWYPRSKGTYTLGTYFENGRWDGLSGKIHGVASVAYHLGFLEAIVVFDVAKEYFNFQFSFR